MAATAVAGSLALAFSTSSPTKRLKFGENMCSLNANQRANHPCRIQPVIECSALSRRLPEARRPVPYLVRPELERLLPQPLRVLPDLEGEVEE